MLKKFINNNFNNILFLYNCNKKEREEVIKNNFRKQDLKISFILLFTYAYYMYLIYCKLKY